MRDDRVTEAARAREKGVAVETFTEVTLDAKKHLIHLDVKLIPVSP